MSANNTTKADTYPTYSIRNLSLSKRVHRSTDPARDFIQPVVSAYWPTIRKRYQPYLSEFLGTLVVVLFGDSVVAQKQLSNGTAGSSLSINAGWGLAVGFGIVASGKSGAHLNPGVTLSLTVFRGFDRKKVIGYIISQLVGGLVGALIMYANYVSAIDNYEGSKGRRTVTGATATAGLFSTYPQPFLNKAGQFFSEFIASAVLMGGILAITDRSNLGTQLTLPAAVGMLIFAIGMCFGWETGYAMNIARDFMPRIASSMIGYGSEVFSVGNYYFWVPTVAPILGMLFGGFLYDLLIYEGESPINMPWMNFPQIYYNFIGIFGFGLEGDSEKINDLEAGQGNSPDSNVDISSKGHDQSTPTQEPVDSYLEQWNNFTFSLRRTSSVPTQFRKPIAHDAGRTGGHAHTLSGSTAIDSGLENQQEIP